MDCPPPPDLGEAARALSTALRERSRDVPWSKIIGMRNILVHDYFGIDKSAVWAAVENDLPALQQQVEDLLETL